MSLSLLCFQLLTSEVTVVPLVRFSEKECFHTCITIVPSLFAMQRQVKDLSLMRVVHQASGAQFYSDAILSISYRKTKYEQSLICAIYGVCYEALL